MSLIPCIYQSSVSHRARDRARIAYPEPYLTRIETISATGCLAVRQTATTLGQAVTQGVPGGVGPAAGPDLAV